MLEDENKLNLYSNAANNVISNLKELAKLTSNEEGAQRVAWGPVWSKSRDWFIKKCQEMGARVEKDSAGNVWAFLSSEQGAFPSRTKSIVIGSHLDSVPNGGWLDGALGVITALEALRVYSTLPPEIKSKYSIYAVDWADEEGARFGYSLAGSSAATGVLDINDISMRVDNQGKIFSQVLLENQIDINKMLDASKELKKRNIATYLELHIEQGPILESKNMPVSAVDVVKGTNRFYIKFSGQSAHAGSFPVPQRKDAFLAAAEAALEFKKIALKYNSVCTVGQVNVLPNVPTIVPSRCTISLDQRSVDILTLNEMYKEAQEAVARIAKENKVQVSWDKVFYIAPTIFNKELVSLCCQAIKEETGSRDLLDKDITISSGPLHDAVNMARLVPTVMMFTKSKDGLSHCKMEDTDVDSLQISIRAFLRLVNKVLQE